LIRETTILNIVRKYIQLLYPRRSRRARKYRFKPQRQ